MTAEDDIAAYLVTLSRGTLPAAGPPVVVGTIFVNDLPASPDAVICVSGYAGQVPEWTNSSKIDKPSVQVLVRGAKNGAGAARTLIETIFRDLDGITNKVLGTSYYSQIEAVQSGTIPMGKDENGRIRYAWNFYCTKLR